MFKVNECGRLMYASRCVLRFEKRRYKGLKPGTPLGALWRFAETLPPGKFVSGM
jgi:hypothetical protein